MSGPSSAILNAGGNAGTEMTKEYLRKLCREQDLYTTAYLNDKLYLHYKGMDPITSI